MKRLFRFLPPLLLAALVLIQFVPVDRSNPPPTQPIRWDAPETEALARRACYDCHSNETVWPWYSYVAPISFQIKSHVDDGRRHLNFSTWDQPNEDLDEVKEMVSEGEMPLWDYEMAHPEAQLTEEETAQLLRGMAATFAQDPPIPRRRRQ